MLPAADLSLPVVTKVLLAWLPVQQNHCKHVELLRLWSNTIGYCIRVLMPD